MWNQFVMHASWRRIVLGALLAGVLVALIFFGLRWLPAWRDRGGPRAATMSAIEDAVETAKVRGVPRGATEFPEEAQPLKVQRSWTNRLNWLWGWLPWLFALGVVYWILNRLLGGLGIGDAARAVFARLRQEAEGQPGNGNGPGANPPPIPPPPPPPPPAGN